MHIDGAHRNHALDGLRGLAALAVFVNHVGTATVGGATVPSWLLWPFDGRAAVMIFFVLSGHVIGLNYPRSAEPKDTGQYALRRLVRLMPINLAGVLLAWLAVRQVDGWTVLANVFFLENFVPYGSFSIPVMPGNENLWSLNYEVLYYLLFILLWRWDLALRPVAGLSLLLACVGWYTGLLPIFLACYATGFLFWLSGLALAWNQQPPVAERSNWPSCLLLLLVTWKVRGLVNVLAAFPIPQFDGPVVMLYFLDILPVSIWLVAAVARQPLPGGNLIKIASALIPLVGLAIKWHRPGYFTPLDYRLALAGYLFALALWNWRPSLSVFRTVAPLGTIAFALYAVGRPIQTYVFAHSQWLPQNHTGYFVCAALTVALALAISWYLEQVVQPAVKRLVASPRQQRPPPSEPPPPSDVQAPLPGN